jgi:predicted RNase H-like HicB family nuclease
MRYGVIVEQIEQAENMPGWFYANVPALGLTTHGNGIEGALNAARDLVQLWADEKRAAGEELSEPQHSVLPTVEII